MSFTTYPDADERIEKFYYLLFLNQGVLLFPKEKDQAMKSHTLKPEKDQTTSLQGGKKQSHHPSSNTSVVDTRQESLQLKKLQHLAHNSPQQQQLAQLQKIVQRQEPHHTVLPIQRKEPPAQLQVQNQSSSWPVIQRAIPNSEYKGDDASEIEAYANKLDKAVQMAWGLIIKTPTLGKFKDLNGYTQLWVKKILTYASTGEDPGGLHTAFGYAVESLVSGPLLPAAGGELKVIQQGARGSTRPDLILQHKKRDVAWLDITASSSSGHIFTKTGGWEQSPSYAEITYPSIGPSDLLEMAKEAKTNPDAEIGAGMDVEEYMARKERAEKELAEKMARWKVKLTEVLAPVKKIGGPFVVDDGPPRRKKTVELLSHLFGTDIPERLAPHILAGAGMNASTYGFRMGYSANASTGRVFLVERNP